jgi:tripartite ATP-independent transporter DctP family solute receptor
MIRRRSLVAGAVAAAIGSTLRAQTPSGAGPTLVAADVHVDGYPTIEAVRWIAGELEREFAGTIRLYHSGQLGREKDTVELSRLGTLDLARVHSSVLNNAVPATRILSLPYVFDSTDHMRRVLDGPVGADILAACASRGLVGLALYDSGSRSFYNTKRPIRVPADLHGLKLRVPQSDIFMRTVRALGGNPTPLAYGEVFSALQTQLIEGAENNWPSFETSRQFEVARYWSQSDHAFTPDILVLSKRRFESLRPVEAEFVLDAARRSVRVMRDHWDRFEASSRTKVLAAGVVANDVDRAAFQDAARPVVAFYMQDPVVERFYRSIRDAA